MNPLLSIICPTLNEEKYIENVLHFFTTAPPQEKEIFIIDGGSKDQTKRIVQQWQASHPNIHLLFNENRFVAYALNLAIPQCQGKYIVRLDAHSDYEPDYFEQILATFEKTNADIVGGPTRTKAVNPTQAAIANAICTPFGIGNSLVHQEDYEGYTDSVTFGAWKREIFQKTGLFDTNLVRNQDDEFHYRAKSLGFTIYQNPAIKLYYYPRASLKSLFKQYFQYGLYKPEVLRKVPSESKLRHWIPALFAIYILLSFLLAFFHWIFLIPLLFYFLIDIYFSFFNHLPPKAKWISLLVYPTIHFAYGLGFLKGLLRILR